MLWHTLRPSGPTLAVPDPQSSALIPLRLNLGGRVALVTGGSGELGNAIALTLAACGADVAVNYHKSRERAEELVKAIAKLGVKSRAIMADVGSMESVIAMRNAVLETLGPVDIVVTNSVEWNEDQPILDQALEAFERSHRSCVLQNVIAAKVFVPSMIERRWGRIIGISSEVAAQAMATKADYVAGKRAMGGVLRVLAREVGKYQVTVNEVAPGWIITDRDRRFVTQVQPKYEANVALHRRGFDQDVANAVAFLASDLASFISGVCLPVCGGNVMSD
jgi:3-oxoacyl-[acyl-carrier protein] reductase